MSCLALSVRVDAYGRLTGRARPRTEMLGEYAKSAGIGDTADGRCQDVDAPGVSPTHRHAAWAQRRNVTLAPKMTNAREVGILTGVGWCGASATCRSPSEVDVTAQRCAVRVTFEVVLVAGFAAVLVTVLAGAFAATLVRAAFVVLAWLTVG